jgi:hypothetical protein
MANWAWKPNRHFGSFSGSMACGKAALSMKKHIQPFRAMPEAIPYKSGPAWHPVRSLQPQRAPTTSAALDETRRGASRGNYPLFIYPLFIARRRRELSHSGGIVPPPHHAHRLGSGFLVGEERGQPERGPGQTPLEPGGVDLHRRIRQAIGDKLPRFPPPFVSHLPQPRPVSFEPPGMINSNFAFASRSLKRSRQRPAASDAPAGLSRLGICWCVLNQPARQM